MTTPTDLRRLRIRFDDSGGPHVTLDGEDYQAPGGPHPDRKSVSGFLDAARADLGSVRVEIVEADGSVYSDVLAPNVEPARRSGAFETYAAGFLPGEPVAVAVIVSEHPASENGTTNVHLPAAVLARRPGKVLLLGRTSGTLTFLGTDR